MQSVQNFTESAPSDLGASSTCFRSSRVPKDDIMPQAIPYRHEVKSTKVPANLGCSQDVCKLASAREQYSAGSAVILSRVVSYRANVFSACLKAWIMSSNQTMRHLPNLAHSRSPDIRHSPKQGYRSPLESFVRFTKRKLKRRDLIPTNFCQICYRNPIETKVVWTYFHSRIYTHRPLIHPQHPRPSPLPGLLPLVPLLKRRRLLVAPAQVVQVLDLVDPDDPVLGREGLLDRAELGPGGGEFAASHAVGSLAGGEERVVVVVRHLVHQAVAHGRRGFVVDAVLAARGEVVAFFDFVGPDTCRMMLAHAAFHVVAME